MPARSLGHADQFAYRLCCGLTDSKTPLSGPKVGSKKIRTARTRAGEGDVPCSTRTRDLAPCEVERPDGAMRRVLLIRDDTAADRDCARFPIGRRKTRILPSELNKLPKRGEGEGASTASNGPPCKAMRRLKCLRGVSLVLHVIPVRSEATDPSCQAGGLGERLPTMVAQIRKDGAHDRARRQRRSRGLFGPPSGPCEPGVEAVFSICISGPRESRQQRCTQKIPAKQTLLGICQPAQQTIKSSQQHGAGGLTSTNFFGLGVVIAGKGVDPLHSLYVLKTRSLHNHP